MAQKTLVVNYEKCTGCRSCEIFCSLKKTHTCNPARSRVCVLSWDEKGTNLPVMCLHCEEPPCALVCPMNAIKKDTESGIVTVDLDRCIGCRSCMMACPFGSISFDPKEHKMVKCDLCQGDPLCAKVCPTGTIKYMRTDRMPMALKREAAKGLARLARLASGQEGGKDA